MLQLILIIFFSAFILIAINKRDLFEPAKLFAIIWIAQMILVKIIFNETYNFTGLNFIYLFISVVVVLIGSVLGQQHVISDKVITTNTYELNITKANRLFYLILILSLIYPFVKISQYGFGVEFILNLNSLLEMNNVIANERYTGGEINTLFDQILLIFLYLAPLYGGYLQTFAQKRKWIYYLVLLPPLFVAISQSMKAGFISSVFMFLASRIVSYRLYTGEFPKITFKVVSKAVFAFTFFLGILFFSMLLRTDGIDSENIRSIAYRFVNYALGHMVAFDVWLNDLYDPNTPFELKTFYGISNVIGLGERMQGVFDEFIDYSNVNFPDEMVTNVFSVFRFLIEDFGVIGSQFFYYFLVCLLDFRTKY
jgi:oligosaccharide repeat unit polymerase